MGDHDLIQRLLGQDESPTLDFKSESLRLDNDFFKAEFIKDVVCMANTPREGSSYVIIGIAHKPGGSKEVIGSSEHPDDANLQTLIAGRVRPIPQFHYRTTPYQEKTIGVLEIFPRRGGPFMPIWGYQDKLRQGIVYFRRGSSNAEAEAEDLREIVGWMGSTEQADKDTQTIESRQTTAGDFGGPPKEPTTEEIASLDIVGSQTAESIASHAEEYTFSGTGVSTTRPFTVRSSFWRLRYKANWSGRFAVQVCGSKIVLVINRGVSDGRVYETYVHGQEGNLHFSIQEAPADGDWTLWVITGKK